MNIKNDLILLTSLYQGKDPHTLEDLPDSHLLRREDIIRALVRACNELEKSIENLGENWTVSEESYLIKLHFSCAKLSTISGELGRSEIDVLNKLVELDILDKKEVA